MYLVLFIISLGLSVALTHQIRSQDSETKENVKAQKRKKRMRNNRQRIAKTKIIKTVEAVALFLFSYLQPVRQVGYLTTCSTFCQ